MLWEPGKLHRLCSWTQLSCHVLWETAPRMQAAQHLASASVPVCVASSCPQLSSESNWAVTIVCCLKRWCEDVRRFCLVHVLGLQVTGLRRPDSPQSAQHMQVSTQNGTLQNGTLQGAQ